MGSVNRVTIMGMIGSAPELKFSRNGKPFVHLSIATHKRSKDEDGGTRRETQWHKVMLWGRNAESCSTYCEKGSSVYIEGHLSPYTKDENGVKTYHVAVMADQVQFLPGSKAERWGEHGRDSFVPRAREGFEGGSPTEQSSPSNGDAIREENSSSLN